MATTKLKYWISQTRSAADERIEDSESISGAKSEVRSKTYSLGNSWSQDIMDKATIRVNELEPYTQESYSLK